MIHILIGETFTMNFKNFHVIWPVYMDSTKSVKQGRRICVDNAISEPNVTEISEALKYLHIRHVIQPYKEYPRHSDRSWDNTGRVMVHLENFQRQHNQRIKSSEFNFDVDNIPKLELDDVVCNVNGSFNKNVLMKNIVKIIPSMPSRIRRLKDMERIEEQERVKKRDEARIIAAAKLVKGGNQKIHKKKGKKKR